MKCVYAKYKQIFKSTFPRTSEIAITQEKIDIYYYKTLVKRSNTSQMKRYIQIGRFDYI